MIERLLPSVLLLLAACAGGRQRPFPVAEPPPVEPTPVGSGHIPPPEPPPPVVVGSPTLVQVAFPTGRATLTPAAQSALDAAVRDFRRFGSARILLTASAGSPALRQARMNAVRNYLIAYGVPADQIGGRGAVLIVESHSSASNVYGGGEPTLPEPARADGPIRHSLSFRSPMMAAAVHLAAIDSWMQPGGTLTARALDALIAACVARDGALSAECEAAAAAGVGRFGMAPKDARDEFAFLLGQCRSVRPDACEKRLRLEHAFRRLKLGRMDPQPRIMREAEPTRFTVAIRADAEGELRVVPGREIGTPSAAAAPDAAATNEARPIVPIADEMCVSIAAEPADFRIDPPLRRCAKEATGSDVRYRFDWRVTPLSAGKLNLGLSTEVNVNGALQPYPLRPYPIAITVEPTQGWWDKLDGAIRRATGTVGLLTTLAKAIGALIAAVTAWSIWAWLRRRKSPARRRPPKR